MINFCEMYKLTKEIQNNGRLVYKIYQRARRTWKFYRTTTPSEAEAVVSELERYNTVIYL